MQSYRNSWIENSTVPSVATNGQTAVVLLLPRRCNSNEVAFVDGECQWHTSAIFRGRFAPTSQPALLVGPALFALLHDDRTFNVRAQTIDGRARGQCARTPFVGAPFIFSTMGTGTGAIHHRDRIRTPVNPPFRLFHLYT